MRRKSIRLDATPAACDVDGDGRGGIVIGAANCRLHAIPAGG